MNEKNILICTPLRFYCQNDETVCFEWISKIKSIKNVQGIGRELHLTIDTNKISNQDLLDLMGLFARYKFKKIDQLRMFINDENAHLFG